MLEAVTLSEQGQHREALARLDAAARLNTPVHGLHYLRSLVLLLLERPEEAAEAAEAEQRHNPGHAPTQELLERLAGPTAVEAAAPEPAPRALFLNTYYPGFLKDLYGKQPRLLQSDYRTQHEALQQACFGDSDFYSHGLRQAGWCAEDLIVNCQPLQQAWARENGFEGEGLAVAAEQIRRARPDVVYLQDLSLATPAFLQAVRPHTTLIVGQIASPVPAGAHLEGLDIIFSSFPHFVTAFRQRGITSYYQPLAFEPRVLERLGDEAVKRSPVSFIGGLSPAHRDRTDLLEQVAARVPVDVYGYGADSLAPGSALRGRHHGEAWGLDMFRALAGSDVTLNVHIDVAEHNANNMRLFEATGCGALLVTDYKNNLADLFEIGEEVVAYRTPEECAALVAYYAAHPEEAARIARAGQERTLRDHSYARRMAQTAEILARHLRYRREAGRFGAVDLKRISYGHTPVRPEEVDARLTTAWKDRSLPAKQRALVQEELERMYRGQAPVVYRVLAEALQPHLRDGMSLLEVGCSSGYYYEVLEYLLGRRIRYTGADYGEAFIDMARDYYPGAAFTAADGAALPFPDAAFDVVVSGGVLLHVPNYREHVAETARVAADLVVAHRTPVCRRRPTQHLRKFAYGVETVELRFNEEELLRTFAAHDLRLVRTIALEQTPEKDEFEFTYVFRKTR